MARLALLIVVVLGISSFSGCARYNSLYMAAAQNDISEVQNMINSGTPVDSPYGQGFTALMAASIDGNLELAKYLLSRGANVNGKNAIGDTPLFYAAHYGRTEVARLLIESGAHLHDVNMSGDTPLMRALFWGQKEVASMLIEKGSYVNRVNASGDTPLSFAVFRRLTEVAKLLMEKGATVNTSSKNGSTPLILAAASGNIELVRLLIAKGADPSMRGEQGKTALEWAKANNHPETSQAIEELSQAAATTALNDELEKLLAKNDQTALKAYLDAHPDALSAIKNPDLRLSYTGPAELRVIDVAQMVKNENRDSLIIAQINSVGGPYKKFTVEEFAALKKLKISDEVVAAMIAVTTAYNKEQKFLAEQKRNLATQAQVKVAKHEAPQPVAVQQPARTEEAPNTLAECVKLAAALKSCDLAGGFLAMGCKAVARSQFNCPGM